MAKKNSPANPLGWWGERWLDYTMDELQIGPASDGQFSSARRARAQIAIDKGWVRATVEVGKYGATEEAVLKVHPLAERGWRKALDAIAADAETAHRLLTGNPGAELESALAAAGAALFPVGAARLRCSCMSRWGCRHVNALVVQGAEFFDANPFLWLEVLGQQRESLFAGLRARLADRGAAAGPVKEAALTAETARAEQPLREDRFWETGTDPDAIALHPGGAAVPDGLLRLLGPLPLPPDSARVELSVGYNLEGHPVDEVLRRFMTRIGEGAAALARGDRAPAYAAWETAGKAIPTGARLAPEVVAAVEREGGLLSLEQLRSLCPSAAALPEHSWRFTLIEATDHLPPEVAVLGGVYVGPRSAVLEGAAFSHVITFGEWRRGVLSPDADWVRALGGAGTLPPVEIRFGAEAQTGETLLAALGAEVGDELCLTVIDPVTPALSATLRRRREREPGERGRASQAAGGALLQHLSETGRQTLAEREAVGVLLGAGQYRQERSPDPVWVLPFQTPGLYHQGSGRGIAGYPGYWQPAFLRPVYYGYWSNQKPLLRLQGALIARGERRQVIEYGTGTVEWWCRFYSGAQDAVQNLPPIGALLYFLWMVAPAEASRYRVSPEMVPEVLGLWFEAVSEGNAALRAAYQGHIAACGLKEAYAHRLRTRPKRTAEAEVREWEVEGARWIGPGPYFGGSAL